MRETEKHAGGGRETTMQFHGALGKFIYGGIARTATSFVMLICFVHLMHDLQCSVKIVGARSARRIFVIICRVDNLFETTVHVLFNDYVL